MHGLKTLRHLNDTAIAETIMKNARADLDKLDPTLEAAIKEHLENKAKNKQQ
jgi:hypothetical protein